MTRILKGRSASGEVRTSRTHPIVVDFIDQQPWKGRLGLTHAPGKRNESYRHFRWHRDLHTDLLRLRDHYGVDVLVTVLEPEEMEWMGISDLREVVLQMGMESLGFALADLDAPAEDDIPEFTALLHAMLARLDAGKHVVAHCRGGLGRSGLVAASLLVLRGKTAREALDSVRRARGEGAVDMPVQEEFVEDLAGMLPHGRGVSDEAGVRDENAVFCKLGESKGGST